MNFDKIQYHSKNYLEKHNIFIENNKIFTTIKFGNKRKQKVEILPDNEKEQRLKELYADRETSRNGRDSFYSKVREKYANITKEFTFDFLKKQTNYQLHLIQPREKTLKPVAYKGINKLWQIDLIDMKKFRSPQNRNKKWILTVIDVFSKYAWAVAMPNKKSYTTRQALEKILDNGYDMTKDYPTMIQSDNGKEFINADFKYLFKVFGITHYRTPSHLPQAQGIIERFNKTLKSLIFSNMTANSNRKYVDDLPILVRNYNNSIHSTIRDKPINIHKKNRKSVKQVKLLENIKENWIKKTHTYPEIKIGDSVRVHILTKSAERQNAIFSKKYLPQWSREIYKVNYILAAESNKVKPTYQLLDSKGKFIHKTFYRHDLQLVN